MTTPYHSKYFAYDLTRAGGKGLDRISQSLFNASVDLNPHQVEAALFALRDVSHGLGILRGQFREAFLVELNPVLVPVRLGFQFKATLLQHRQIRVSTLEQQSFWLAESGVQRALHQLRASADYRGETWEVPAETLGAGAAGIVTIQVQPTTQPQEGWDVRVESRYPAEALPRAMFERSVFVAKR